MRTGGGRAGFGVAVWLRGGVSSRLERERA